MKRTLAVLFALLLLPIVAAAGVYEDMEEALISGDTAWAIKLINRGMDVNSVDAAGNTLLMQTVNRDNQEFFDYLLKRRARINTRNRNGETALSLAAYRGKLHFVQRLVDSGADVNLYGWPPLIYAAFNGHTAVAEYLLKKGAEVNGTTENGSTALLFAARFGHIEVVELLLLNKADPNIANERGATAIDWALKTDNTDIADLLRKAGGRAGDQPAGPPSR
ncbi:ankyrin repeat domain-containing protein [Accumulibacter sp.]|jgi:ankyrin repeat protein|uniref:Ankyrin n=1 Tax=Accumulibacter regalis TaxID=522306 RepID=C7RR74_ACCRE|nr:ankyrin repeat domain-containing protein [Accumulibacter sp.]MBN8495355.1 ankyrin repeat domain-containing protein [Accumulibacter sp.]MBO3715712.1 ankyrin repeat domain-containing protein [Accumulibacter sp.]